MNVKELNWRQIQWAMKLAAFHFVISHRVKKTNLTDTLSHCSNYNDIDKVSEIIKTLLLTLQRKLIALVTVFSLKLTPLIGWVILGMRAAEIRVFEPRTEVLVSEDRTSALWRCNVAETQLNSATETVNCKQLISHMMMRELVIHETADEKFS